MTALCGSPHHQHPDTVCTEPAGHYVRDRDPHAGPLILDGRECGVAAWDEPDTSKERLVIQPGQTYYSLSTRHHPCDGPTRIKVVGDPETVIGICTVGKVDIVTLTSTGREIRRRAIETSQLHETATTKTGQPRRTGYVLEAP